MLNTTRVLKSHIVMMLSVALFSMSAFSGQIGSHKFPDGPVLDKTPGALCDKPDAHRYPAKIAYCNRDVETNLKNRIFAAYDQELGFNCRKLPRGDFKIDHFIPLSIGGSNDEANLWPQHKSVYKHSDPVESHLANLIADDKISQEKAIEVIKDCKLNLERCADVVEYLETLY